MSDMWVIWSEEHGAWWRPGYMGYTTSLVEAGRYSEDDARGIVRRANQYIKPPRFNEVAIPDPVYDLHPIRWMMTT